MGKTITSLKFWRTTVAMTVLATTIILATILREPKIAIAAIPALCYITIATEKKNEQDKIK